MSDLNLISVMEDTKAVLSGQNMEMGALTDPSQKAIMDQFVALPRSVRETLLKGLLVLPTEILFRLSGDEFAFRTRHTKIHQHMPLMFDFLSNPEVARQACEVFYRDNTFSIQPQDLPNLFSEQAGVWIADEIIKPKDLITKVVVYIELDDDEIITRRFADQMEELLKCTTLEEAQIMIIGDVESLTSFIPVKKFTKVVTVCGILREHMGSKLGVGIYRVMDQIADDKALEELFWGLEGEGWQ